MRKLQFVIAKENRPSAVQNLGRRFMIMFIYVYIFIDLYLFILQFSQDT